MVRGPSPQTLSFWSFLVFEHMIMDKGHERNDSKRAALLNTVLLIESVEKLSIKRWSSF
jgi:hypothetical protein